MKKGINIAMAVLQVIIAIGLFIGIYLLFDAANDLINRVPEISSAVCDACIENQENPFGDYAPQELPKNALWVYTLPVVLLIIGIYFLTVSIKEVNKK
jgi:uncharacterized membrane protein HdeD (DUF308 family)